MDDPTSWPRLRTGSPSISLILFVPLVSFSLAFILDIILPASDFEVSRDIKKMSLKMY